MSSPTLKGLGYERTIHRDDEGNLDIVNFVKEDITGIQKINITVQHREIEAYTVNKAGKIQIEILSPELIMALYSELEDIGLIQ
jgi:hypothetical protein